MNNTEAGLLGGGLVGGATGAILGRGNPVATLAGAGIGAAVGGVSGAHQDARIDNRNRAVQQAVANQARNQMTLADVVNLSQRGTSPDIIIQQIDSTGSVFNLTTNDVIYLQDQNVNSRVISVMQTRRARAVVVGGPPAVVYAPPPPPGTMVIMEPPPPPPLTTGVFIRAGH